MSTLKWDKEFALEQAADDAELLQELLDIFKDSFQTDLSIIAEGIQLESAEKVADAAHSIKGAAISLGIQGVADLVMELESDGRAGELELAKESLPRLQTMLEELQKM